MKKILILLFMVLEIISNAQVNKMLLPIASDCKNAIKINVGKRGIYGPTVAPIGFGQVQEIQGNNKRNCFSFEKEHNSAWYYFDVPHDGELVLNIIPIDSADDYDFMLFKAESNFCFLLANNKVKPTRSNVSRSGKGGKSVTGLSNIGKENLVHSGPGETFSKTLEVKKGESYYLVLDNVSYCGSGHTINLGYQKIVQVEGVVLSDDNKPIQTEVILADTQGHEVKTQTDSFGNYNINAHLWESFAYSISFFNDSYFVNSKIINDDSLFKADYKLNDIKTVLPLLKGGKTYTLAGINFYTGLTILLPESHSSVYSLCKLMKKNKKMKIRIEGHVSIPGPPQYDGYWKELSEKRAHAIYDFLLSKGIEKKRMKIIGFSNLHPIFPKPSTNEEDEANRRVEINVLSLDK